MSGVRTPRQRHAVLKKLSRTWEANPHMRLCQVIVNATQRDDPFYVEDDDLMAGLDGLAADRDPKPGLP